MSTDISILSLEKKIDDLNQQAWDIRVTDSPKAFTLSQESVKLARSINYPPGLAFALQLLGFCYIRLSKYEEALPLLNESLSLFRSLNDLQGEAIIYEYQAIIQRTWGDLGGALELLFKSNDITEPNGFTEIIATNHYQLGVTYKHLGNFEKALDHFYRSMEACRKIESSLFESYSINLIGSIYFENGDYEHALDYYQQGLVFRHEAGDKWGEAGSLDNIGFTHLKLKNFEQAIDHCKKSLEISRGTDDKRGQANALIHLAEIYKQKNDIIKAAEFSNESLEIRKNSGDKKGEAEICLFLADLYKAQPGKDKNVFEWLNNSLKIAEETKALDLLSKTRFHLYEYYKNKGDYEKALENLDLHTKLEKEFHKNTIDQKVSNLEISHKAEAISQRNKELTELNEKIEKANEELKIEASLERVRAVTMSMSKTEDVLNICKVMFAELQTLGFKDLRNSLINFWDDDNSLLLDYDYSDFSGGNFARHSYNSHPVFEAFQKKVRKATDAFAELAITEEELESWKQRRRDSGEYEDPRLNNISALYYYFYSTGVGAVGISTFSPISKDKLEVLKRFRNVFDLTYRRYLDIVKAEAQAREAQIQLALERVRARTMAMQRSDELPQAATLLFQQVQSLDIHLFSTGYNIWDENKKTVTSSMSSGGIIQPSFRLPLTEETSLIECFEAGQRGDIFFAQELGGAKLHSHLKYMRTLPVIGELMNKIAEAGFPLPDYMINHHAFFSHGYLLFITYAPVPDAHEIFKRFAKVFEQTYTRFLDLQKAEAQAKEAQTEVALERIRARAMAMHSSNELMDVAHILREQMGSLDQPDLETSVVNLFDEDSDYIHSWHAFREPGSSSGRTIHGTVSFRKDSSALTREMLDLYHSGKKEYTLEATGEKLNEFIQVLVNAQPEISNYIGKHPPEKVFYHFATFTGGALLTVSYQPTTEDIKSLQRRAASVFDMAYRRYLDLKKAEAQTREVQIEIAVERVRAKALAMHKSEEILAVVATLRNELQGLNIPGVSGTTIYLKQDDGQVRMWDLTNVIELQDGFHLTLDIVFPLEETHPELYVRKLWNATEKYSIQIQDRNDLMRTIEWVSQYKKEDAENIKQFIESVDLKYLYHSTIQLSNGKLSVDLMEPPPAEMESILQKMATAFDLAYKRFLDLQKAEAQAKEAQIEVALERVRSRTMAMHKSDELAETAQLLYHEFGKLGINTFTCGYMFIDEAKNTQTGWFVLPDGTLLPNFIVFPLTGDHILDKRYEDWKEKKLLHVFEIQGEVNKEHHRFLSKHVPPFVVRDIFSQMPDRIIFHCANFSYGYLLILATEFLSEEEQQTIIRFAKVFDLTYRRFLDLQKAEAQAREAQIEAALERVRSKTMAMQRSEELDSVIKTVYAELKHLDVSFDRCFIMIFDEQKGATWWMGSAEDDLFHEGFYVQYHTHPPHLAYLKGWEERQQKWEYLLGGQIKKDWDEFIFNKTELSKLPPIAIQYMKSFDSAHLAASFENFGCMTTGGQERVSEESFSILSRFTKVFDQTYTRFKDLKQAEAQAREAQIEAALERVRSRTMGMQKSDELRDVVSVVFEQLLHLGFPSDGCAIILYDKKDLSSEYWMTIPGNSLPQSFTIPYFDHPYYKEELEAWKKGVTYHSIVYEGELKKTFEQFCLNHSPFVEITDDLKEVLAANERSVASLAFMDYGSLSVLGPEALSEENAIILQRFTKVFDQAYTRFLDLQNAEAQTREAQIEAALERVRAKVMAMMSSKDLNETSLVFGEQLRKLGIDWQFSYFWLIDEAKNDTTFWITWPDYKTSFTAYSLAEAAEYFDDCLVAWRGGVKIHDNYVPPEGVQAWLDTFQRIADDAGGVAKEIMVAATFPTGVYYYDAMMKYGSFGISINKPATDEEKKIQCRFAIEFERAYTRFLDLKQAEAQTRESQIELGLERVRARAMAMQNSDELKELIGTVYTELTKLDLILDRCFIMIYDNRSMGVTWWMSNPEAPLQPIGLFVKYHEQPPYLDFIKAWKEKNLKWQYVLEGEVKKTWDKFLFVETELSQLPDFIIANMKANEKVYLSASFNNFGCLTLATLESLSDEHFDILLRFAKVFDLTYTRFNDLKQAEAQAREAKIEAALERVRAKAMAMHQSEDLNPAVETVFEELDKLNIGILRCGIAIMDRDKPRGDVWITVKSEQGNTIQVSGDESLDYHPLLRGAYDGWLKHEDFSYVLQGKDLISYYRDVASMKYQLPVSTSFDTEKKDQQQYYYNAVFQDGSLFAFMETAINDEAKTVMKRFANVFNLTYKRFLDLQKAEAQTREAKIEAALERVRARALAMQEPEELKDVAQVLRTEMGLLGVEELETCSIYINDEATNKTECWYALKDVREEEKKLVSDHFPLNLNDTWVGREMKSFYRSDAKQVSIVMQGANRKEWINYCEERSIPFRGYYGEIIPDRTYHLYKFSHGAIGAAAAGDISAESWKLLSRAASVFSLAYSRFKDLTQARNDLIQLKEEKKRAEDALTELQTTQKQLIQAEKMASLGELTAGIAHEIQNPLNFVNNFSDVSNELLEEMKVELEKGNAEEAKAIAIDVKENLEKILHHGKRADAIVKGMLQHSRTSSGQKELTDINILAEEYLRLAYHGLRAKDKFFNAKFETDLDPSVDKINIVPQEIGRVILNLINNSFYAVSEKKKVTSNGYEPTVTVSTRKVDDTVEIKVKDNGNGIPQKVLDKIFQPFFTTKPTGQGTGLGLSLSYDIVTKGHEGEIKVETKEGEGSTFIISLPVK